MGIEPPAPSTHKGGRPGDRGRIEGAEGSPVELMLTDEKEGAIMKYEHKKMK